METELKLELAARDAPLIAAAPLLHGKGKARRLVSTYFDTDAGALRRAGLTLRVRQDGSRRVQTVKAEAAGSGLFVRPEWERVIDGDTPQIDVGAGPVAELVGSDALRPRFVTEVMRVVRIVERGGARVELALDTGEIRSGEVTLPFAEVELELRDGPVAALFSIARLLGEAAPLRLAVQSKAERGHTLETGAGHADKAEPVAIDPDSDAVQAFAAIAHACLRQFRLNEARLLAGDAAAAPLHQARVGLRRLRSAFSVFGSILKKDRQASYFAGQLRALAAILGDVRDLDVLADRHVGVVRERIVAERIAAFQIARERLASVATRRLMLDLAEWLALGEWRTAPAKPARAHAEIAPFAADLLARRRKRLKRNGRHLATLDVHRRHRVRIQAKKLRYATEFFGGLWRGRKARHRRERFADAIEQLQDELGHLNDTAHGDVILARLGIAVPALAPTGEVADLAPSIAAFEAVVDARRFWR